MIDVVNFKNDIINKNINYKFAVLKYSDTDFLAFQYVNEIAKVLNKPVKIIDVKSNVRNKVLVGEPIKVTAQSEGGIVPVYLV